MKRRGLVMVVAAFGALVVAGCAATTDQPSDVTASSAVFRAQGRTDSTPAHYYFQYSVNPNALGTGFGQQTPTRGPIPAGVQTSGGGLVPFSEAVSGLKPSTTYYYRVCGGDGQTSGDVCAQVRSFTTPPLFDRPGTYSLIVPAGVTRARFDVSGAQGGAGNSLAPGGGGAHVRAVLAVHAGDTLTVVVGGRGGDAPSSNPTVAAAGGSGGGGAGGAGAFAGGGGGGGASDVRTGSDLSTRLLVASGGGGGVPAPGSSGPKGGDGGLVGENGQDGPCQSQIGPCTPSRGGGGGTATAGGTATGGPPTQFYTPPQSGGLGVGGSGGTNLFADGGTQSFGAGGGGGGAGYYGGGGGDGGIYERLRSNVPGAGGGGSSFITPSAQCSSPVDTGAQSGDGAVTMTYNPGPC